MTVTTQPPADQTPSAATGIDAVIRLRPEQVGQHPDNIRDAGRDIPALAASIREVGVLVPLIVVPAHTAPGGWPDTVTHVAVNGNRRVAAAARAGVDVPCLVRDTTATARDTMVTMAVTGLVRTASPAPSRLHAVQTMPEPRTVPGGDRPSHRYETRHRQNRADGRDLGFLRDGGHRRRAPWWASWEHALVAITKVIHGGVPANRRLHRIRRAISLPDRGGECIRGARN